MTKREELLHLVCAFIQRGVLTPAAILEAKKELAIFETEFCAPEEPAPSATQDGPKTAAVKKLLRELPEPYASMAISQMLPEEKLGRSDTLTCSGALITFADWHNTKEGKDFWSMVCCASCTKNWSQLPPIPGAEEPKETSELKAMRRENENLKAELAAELARPTVWPEELSEEKVFEWINELKRPIYETWSPKNEYRALVKIMGGIPKQRTYSEAFLVILRNVVDSETLTQVAARLDAEEAAKSKKEAQP